MKILILLMSMKTILSNEKSNFLNPKKVEIAINCGLFSKLDSFSEFTYSEVNNNYS